MMQQTTPGQVRAPSQQNDQVMTRMICANPMVREGREVEAAHGATASRCPSLFHSTGAGDGASRDIPTELSSRNPLCDLNSTTVHRTGATQTANVTTPVRCSSIFRFGGDAGAVRNASVGSGLVSPPYEWLTAPTLHSRPTGAASEHADARHGVVGDPEPADDTFDVDDSVNRELDQDGKRDSASSLTQGTDKTSNGERGQYPQYHHNAVVPPGAAPAEHARQNELNTCGGRTDAAISSLPSTYGASSAIQPSSRFDDFPQRNNDVTLHASMPPASSSARVRAIFYPHKGPEHGVFSEPEPAEDIFDVDGFVNRELERHGERDPASSLTQGNEATDNISNGERMDHHYHHNAVGPPSAVPGEHVRLAYVQKELSTCGGRTDAAISSLPSTSGASSAARPSSRSGDFSQRNNDITLNASTPPTSSSARARTIFYAQKGKVQREPSTLLSDSRPRHVESHSKDRQRTRLQVEYVPATDAVANRNTAILYESRDAERRRSATMPGSVERERALHLEQLETTLLEEKRGAVERRKTYLELRGGRNAISTVTATESGDPCAPCRSTCVRNCTTNGNTGVCATDGTGERANEFTGVCTADGTDVRTNEFTDVCGPRYASARIRDYTGVRANELTGVCAPDYNGVRVRDCSGLGGTLGVRNREITGLCGPDHTDVRVQDCTGSGSTRGVRTGAQKRKLVEHETKYPGESPKGNPLSKGRATKLDECTHDGGYSLPVAPLVKCLYCTEEFSSAHKVNSHMAESHAREYFASFSVKCPMCSAFYKTKTGLFRHAEAEHSHDEVREHTEFVQCEHCSTVCSPQGMNRHLQFRGCAPPRH